MNALAYLGGHRVTPKRLRGRGSILTFHRVRPAGAQSQFSPNAGLEITPEFLESVILRLREREFDIVSLDEAWTRTGLTQAPRRFACLTFDDGYRDNFEYAFPICQKLNVPFTVYVTTGFVDGENSAWWLGLEQLVRSECQIKFSWRGVFHKYSLSTLAEKRKTFNEISALFLSLSPRLREMLCAQLGELSGIDFRATTARATMSWDMVREMERSGLAHIGGHTVSHPRLAALDIDVAKAEIRDGCRTLEEIIGRRIRHFAYPFGRKVDAGPREFAICKELNFCTAVTTRNGNIMHEHSRRCWDLPRLNVSGTRQSLGAIEVMLSGAPSALRNGFFKLH